MRLRTPLAWFNLTYKRQRLLTALAGVTFAVVLMFLFKGFENALYDSQLRLLKIFNGDIVMVNRIKTNMFIPEKFARRRLYQAEAFDGIDAAYPLYTTTADWKNPDTKKIRPLRVLAFNMDDPVLPLPEILEARSLLQMPRTALVDSKSRPKVGSRTPGTVTEVAKQSVKIVGTFPLGTDFTSGNGNVVMSDQNFVRYFSSLGPDEDSRDLNTVDLGLLKVAPGADVPTLVKTLTQQLPNDILLFSKEDFVQRELNYWKQSTNIGFVFSLLATMSFLVGVIIVYQILYTDVAEHWAEYATLKAMGYSNFFLLKIVLQQAIFMGLLGFVPGFLISWGLYNLTADATGLLMQMTTTRAIRTLITTVIMCLISGSIAVRKVQSTDPAEVFGT
jgi:putative ABC transport system permease protein